MLEQINKLWGLPKGNCPDWSLSEEFVIKGNSLQSKKSSISSRHPLHRKQCQALIGNFWTGNDWLIDWLGFFYHSLFLSLPFLIFFFFFLIRQFRNQRHSWPGLFPQLTQFSHLLSGFRWLCRDKKFCCALLEAHLLLQLWPGVSLVICRS